MEFGGSSVVIGGWWGEGFWLVRLGRRVKGEGRVGDIVSLMIS